MKPEGRDPAGKTKETVIAGVFAGRPGGCSAARMACIPNHQDKAPVSAPPIQAPNSATRI
jgi:hypothetical protein